MSNKELDQALEGPIVAVQYPDKPSFSVSASSATELSVKYSHLKDLDVDDKKAYKELTAAISDVSSNRILITKEEDAIKKPLNAFRKIVIDTGKALRAAFEPIENSLREEKDRIDTILADREAAKQKVFDDNFRSLCSIESKYLGGMELEQIFEHVESLKKEEITVDRFGPHLGDAEELLMNLFQRAQGAIHAKKEQIKFEEEKAAFEKQQKEAADQKARDDAEKAEMAAKIAKLEAESKPVVSIDNDSRPLTEIYSRCVSNDIDTGEPKPIETVFFDNDQKVEAPKGVTGYVKINNDAIVTEVIHDGAALGMFIATLGRANNMRVISKSQEQNEAVNRVKETLVKAIGYLEKFDV